MPIDDDRTLEDRSGPTLMPVWAIGDRGFYVLPKSQAASRPKDLYLAITVINVTANRVVVRCAGSNGRSGHRVLKPDVLVKTAPVGAWVR